MNRSYASAATVKVTVGIYAARASRLYSFSAHR